MKCLITIGKYTVIEGIRDKILYVSLFIIFSLLLFSSYLSLLTLTSPEVAFLSFSFYFLKAFSMFALIFMVVFGLYREKRKKAYQIILIRLYNKAYYIWGKFFGYNILYFLITFIVLIFIFITNYVLWDELNLKIFLYSPILSLQFFIISGVIFILYLIITSPILTAIISIAIFFGAHFSLDFYIFAVKTSKGLIKSLYALIYFIFPNLEPYILEKNIIHNLTISNSFIINLFVYSISYGLLIIFLSGVIFNNKRDY